MKKIKSIFRTTGNMLIFIGLLLKHPFEWVYLEIKNYILNKIELRKFNKAKKTADHLHATTGKRYHVVPSGKNKLAVVNNDYIKLYNKTKGVKKKINIHTLIKLSYYSTK